MIPEQQVQITKKHAGGRPLKFKSVSTLMRSANEYFSTTEQSLWTITGLALALGTNRKTLIEYAHNDEFSNAIQTLKAKVEHAYELRGMDKSTAFDIFRLKNMGWADKVEINSMNVNVEVELDPQAAEDFSKFLNSL